jgi:hypothetical protein
METLLTQIEKNKIINRNYSDEYILFFVHKILFHAVLHGIYVKKHSSHRRERIMPDRRQNISGIF